MGFQHLQKIKIAKTAHPVRPLAPRRGLPNGFVRYLVADHGDDPAALGHSLATLFGGCRFDAATDVPGHSAGLYLAEMTWVKVAYLEVDRPWVLRATRLPKDAQLVIVPTEGTVLVRSGTTSTWLDSTTAGFPARRRPVRVESDGAGPLMILSLEVHGLRRGLDALLGRTFVDEVVFDEKMNLTELSAERWQSALALLHGEIALLEPGAEVPVEAQPLESLVLTTILVTHQSSCTVELLRMPGVRRNRVARRAVDHIEAHLDEPISMADIARAAGVSVRAVQSTFRDLLDTTPMNYVRDRRLEAAREDLLRYGPGDGVTIAMVASDWGFSNAGRFATAYRQRFGEPPSATFRR